MSEKMETVTIRLPKRVIDFYKKSNVGHTTAMREILWQAYAKVAEDLTPEDEMRKLYALSKFNPDRDNTT